MEETARTKRIKILIADDQEMVREGLRQLFRTQGDLEVVGEAKDGVEAVELAGSLRPDILVLDLAMPRLGGLETTRRLRDSLGETKVVVLSMFPPETHQRQAIEAGAKGYVRKGSPVAELLKIIRLAHAGMTPPGPQV